MGRPRLGGHGAFERKGGRWLARVLPWLQHAGPGIALKTVAKGARLGGRGREAKRGILKCH